MIGESRADSKVLNLAVAASQMSASNGAPHITESDFLAVEMDSSANDKVRSKSLRDRAAAISAGISNSAKNKSSKGKVAKDADPRGNAATGSQTSQAARVTRQQAAQNGGAHAARSGKDSRDDPSSLTAPGMEPSDGDASNKGDTRPINRGGDVVGDILELQEETHGRNSKEPPAKRPREDPPAGGSTNSPSGEFNISLELLGAIKNLNNSLTSTLTTNVSGMRDDFKGLASSMSDNFQKLSSKLTRTQRHEDYSSGESSGESSSSEDDDYADYE